MIEFTTDWYQKENLQRLVALVKSTRGGAFIEVGCWEGRSSIELANAIYPNSLICIDTWRGSAPDGYVVKDHSVYDRFIGNMYEATKGNFSVYRMSWENYGWDKLPGIGFLHIDAEHTYEAVKGNIEVAYPKMISGGIICGDDYYHEPVKKAVGECLPGAVGLSPALWAWTAP